MSELTKQELEAIAAAGAEKGIANVLGCVFDPAPCQEKKDLGKTEEGKQ